MGISPAMLNVSVTTATDFVFSRDHNFSSLAIEQRNVCVGDGVILSLDNGSIGLEELWKLELYYFTCIYLSSIASIYQCILFLIDPIIYYIHLSIELSVYIDVCTTYGICQI